MYIKQVIISGFRSFRSQNEIEQFSPKHNVIVGRNGSGKSNFFDAIQFVLLAPKFATLRQEDRQHLLHEGAGSSVMAAYVEIIFDNSDGRLSVETDEVVLRRTVGLKKDEYFLNRKRVQKSEIQSLLESAGFSKSNPYYIVQQGKVANLCVMKDTDRLNLLKEIAGTTVYEERRAESLAIIQDANSKQERITEVLQFIEERLNELELEKKELTEYEQHDKNRRALEYTIYHVDYTKASEKLNSIEMIHVEERENQNALQEEMNTKHEELNEREEELSSMKNQLTRLQIKVKEKNDEIKIQNMKLIEYNTLVDDYTMTAKSRYEEKQNVLNQLQIIQQQKLALETEIAQYEPVYQQQHANYTAIKNEYISIHQRVEILYNKQGRNQQFRNKKQRDAFLNQQIKTLETSITTQNTLYQTMNNDISLTQSRYTSEQDSLQTLDTEIKSKKQSIQSFTTQLHELTQQRNTSQESRKVLWKQQEQIQEETSLMKLEIEKAEFQLNSTLPKNISSGLKIIEQIVNEKEITGYYGPLIDNFSLKNTAFQTAIEVSAGNALFHIIVDTDTTAAVLIHELEKRKAGRLTFLPLNRLRVPPVTYPDSKDVRPLLSVACTYDTQFDSAMKQVFSKKLLARDLTVAAHYSTEYELDAVTRDGDIVNRRGGFEGGYRDEKTSKFNAVLKIRACNQSLATLQQQDAEIQSSLDILEQQINQYCREIQSKENEKNNASQFIHHALIEYTERSHQNNTILKKSIEMKKIDAIELSTLLQSSQMQLQSYTEEISLPLFHQLNEDEKNELKALSERERDMKNQSDTLELTFLSVSEKLNQLKAELNDNVCKRYEEYQVKLASYPSNTSSNSNNSSSSGSQQSEGNEDENDDSMELSSSSSSSSQQSSSSSQSQLILSKDPEYLALIPQRDFLQSSLTQLSQEVSEYELLLSEKTTAFSDMEKEVDTLKLQEKECMQSLQQAMTRQDKYLNKRTMLIDTITSKQKLIRDLGLLPKQEIALYQNKSEKQLLAFLQEVNESIKKYGNVNKKALDQYISFNEQRETLISRRQELISDNTAIEKLIESLDLQKDEAILRTFRGVSQHFANVFSELVPQGQGQLVMKTSSNSSGESDDDGEEEFVLEESQNDGSKNKNADESESENDSDDKDEDDDANNKKRQSKKKKIVSDNKKKRGSGSSSASTSTSANNKKNKTSKAITTTVASAAATKKASLELKAVSSFTGIQIRVSFSGTGQMFDMQQLSGGQKALVALALIFAIQRCDPAPFYLFDEIDQALDGNYRSNVAKLIQKQVDSIDAPAQFITTTFRSEFVAVANKCYGIGLQNKVSNIYPLEKIDAQNFVTNLMNEDEAVGTVAAIPIYTGNKNNRNNNKNQQQQRQQQRDGNDGEEEEEDENDENDDENSDDNHDNNDDDDDSPSGDTRKRKQISRSSASSRARATGNRGGSGNTSTGSRGKQSLSSSSKPPTNKNQVQNKGGRVAGGNKNNQKGNNCADDDDDDDDNDSDNDNGNDNEDEELDEEDEALIEEGLAYLQALDLTGGAGGRKSRSASSSGGGTTMAARGEVGGQSSRRTTAGTGSSINSRSRRGSGNNKYDQQDDEEEGGEEQEEEEEEDEEYDDDDTRKAAALAKKSTSTAASTATAVSRKRRTTRV